MIRQILCSLVAASALASCGSESSSWAAACGELSTVLAFPLGDTYWLKNKSDYQEDLSFQQQSFVGAIIDLPPGLPDSISLDITSRDITAISVRYGSIESVIVAHDFGASVNDLATSLAEKLSEPDGQALLEFEAQDFRRQVEWYRKFGQGAFRCDVDSVLRDAKKFVVEYQLQPIKSYQEASNARIFRDGIKTNFDSGIFSVQLPKSGWLVTTFVTTPGNPEQIVDDDDWSQEFFGALGDYLVSDELDLSELADITRENNIQFEVYKYGVLQEE